MPANDPMPHATPGCVQWPNTRPAPRCETMHAKASSVSWRHDSIAKIHLCVPKCEGVCV